MFYSNELLCLKGGRFGLIWYLAINNPFKDNSTLTKRGGRGRHGNSAVSLSEILSVDLKPVLHDLLRRLPIDSPEAFSLRLSATLLIGTVRCHVIRVSMLLRDAKNCRRKKPKPQICDHTPNIDKKQVLPEIGSDICQLGGNENTQFGNVAYNEDDFAQMLDNAIEERMKHGHPFTMSEDDQLMRAEDDGCFGPPLANVDVDIFEAEFQEPLQQPQQDEQPLQFEDEEPQQFQVEQPQQFQDEQPQQFQDEQEMLVPPETDFQTEEPRDMFPAAEPVNGTQQNVNVLETPGAPKRKGSAPIRCEETVLPEQEGPAEEARRSKRRRSSDAPDSRRNLFEDQDEEEEDLPLAAAPEITKRPGPKKKRRKGQLAIDAITKIGEAEMRSNLTSDRDDVYERIEYANLQPDENWMLATGRRPFLNAQLKDRFWQVAVKPTVEEEVEIEREENLEGHEATLMSESRTSRIGKRRANPSFQIELPSNGSLILEEEREAPLAEEAEGEQGIEHMNIDQDYPNEPPDLVQEAFEPHVPLVEDPTAPHIEETEEAFADIIPPPAAAQASAPLSPYGGSFYPSADNLLDYIRDCQENNFTAVLDDFESQPTTKREAALAFRRLLDLEARRLVKCQQKEFYGPIRIRVL